MKCIDLENYFSHKKVTPKSTEDRFIVFGSVILLIYIELHLFIQVSYNLQKFPGFYYPYLLETASTTTVMGLILKLARLQSDYANQCY